MDNTFTKFKENENSEFQKSEKKWWNGHAYLPLFNYYLTYNYLNSNIIIDYEYRQSEFSKPSAIDGGAFGDRHNCNVICKITVDKKYPKFGITERGILAKIFNRNTELFYKINCNDSNLKNFLKGNIILNKIFLIVENSPEFSPLIEAKMKDGDYELIIRYNTQQKNEEVLILINDFCKKLVDFLNE